MLFNSLEFALFLPIVFLAYWFMVNRKLKLQNLFIVVVSYLFYGWWDWRFLLLIALTTACSYISGILIERYRKDQVTAETGSVQIKKIKIFSTSKLVALVNIVLNLLILGLFKYFNFFAENLQHLFRVFGFELDWVTVDILLPVGISFYTFQALSYTIDVYRGNIKATRDVAAFFAYVSFFPQLVAGPIERATNLLPQFYVKRRFDYAKAVDGMRQILWGFFKKMVVADNCALAVNAIFGDYQSQSGSTLILGGILFAFQIYGDFSGYSDIAIGCARLFGINLMRNFNFPYFSRDIAEFWRRWHISLTTWFRDYIYIPLGGSRGTKLRSFRNTMIIFLVSGLWHGANWTFIIWGVFHALLFVPLLLSGRNRKYIDCVAADRVLPSLRELWQLIATFALATLGWIVFRAENVAQAFDYIKRIFSPTIFTMPSIGKKELVFIALLLIVEWFARRNQHALEHIPIRSRMLRWVLYLFLTLSILIFGAEQQSFIYFQF